MTKKIVLTTAQAAAVSHLASDHAFDLDEYCDGEPDQLFYDQDIDFVLEDFAVGAESAEPCQVCQKFQVDLGFREE